MHAQWYFGKIQPSYINPHKSLHFVKNEKNHSRSPPSTPPPSKPLKQTQKTPPPSSPLPHGNKHTLNVFHRYKTKTVSKHYNIQPHLK